MYRELEKLRKQKEADELIGCTFQPNLVLSQKSNKKIRMSTEESIEKGKNLYEQGKILMEKRAARKIPIIEQEFERFREFCVFKPEIHE